MDNRIAVLDDHSLITEAISSIVGSNSAYSFAGGFSSSAELVSYIEEHTAPSYLLLDIHLTKEDGIVLCKEFSKRYPEMKVIMLTGISEPAVIKNAIKNGCAGFQLKNMKSEDLWECIDKIKTGELYLHREVERIMLRSAIESRSPSTDYIPRLSKREAEILQLIVKELTTHEIASTLFISVNTVETHRASLLSKLGARNTAGLVKAALEKGLVK
ncbi:LuxR C-terminal-related transcriptional regulator [Pseudoflavitalea rhizosphaerae]|uniref:LuxR C-terminal-related transcriptional regulator n=1 Tax=Pseudoflavitalea rhizosphaerae TaxID=1884793 RepID=UPI0013DED0D1|nr:response regulator transcription factor [Pseudoflavitalea rhizosphaerae]